MDSTAALSQLLKHFTAEQLTVLAQQITLAQEQARARGVRHFDVIITFQNYHPRSVTIPNRVNLPGGDE